MMAKTETLQLSTSVLDWAARQAGASLHDIATKVSKRFDNIEAGNLTPTQAAKFAKLVNVPFGYLFFTSPPEERSLPLADLRSIQDREPLGQEFFDTYDDLVFKQVWLSDYRKNSASKELSFVGKFRGKKITAKQLANEISTDLGLTTQDLRAVKSIEELYALIAEAAEEVGVMVMKNGVVANNTHRPLPISQFRGFAVSDPYAPAVFINGGDARAAWAFTLLHELAHLWLGVSGVSDGSPAPSDTTEILCNAAAAEILVPAVEFLSEWKTHDTVDAITKIDFLRRHFKVSGLVIARRALDGGLISWNIYQTVYKAALKRKPSSGGDFYMTLGARNGKRFSQTVANLAYGGELSLRYAGRLLNTTPANVLNFRNRRNAVSN